MNVLIFGATGSIGDSFFSIVRKNKSKINVVGATCNKRIKKLSKLCDEFKIEQVGIENYNMYQKFTKKSKYPKKKILGIKNFNKLINKNIDIIIFAISGLASLKLALDIAKSGKIIGLANKECIISLGKNFINLSNKSNSTIIPLDSEHNSIYRLIQSSNKIFHSITITASGGPFLNKSKSYLKTITTKEATSHPIWKMGKKISVDSATLMNKSLEIIEASILFNLSEKQIKAIIHPESILHASLNYDDGTSECLLSRPDMRISISSLFEEIDKKNFSNNFLDIRHMSQLTFRKIDVSQFPSIKLGYKVLKKGGLAPHIFNYNNDLLVNMFLKDKIKYLDIVRYNEITIDKFFKKNKNIKNPNYNQIINTSRWIEKNIYLGNL